MAEFFEALKTSFTDTFGETVSLGGNRILTLNIIVWSIFVGFLIGIGATIYNKVILGAFVRSVTKKKLLTPESGETLEELGHNNIFVRFALRKSGTFRKIVLMSGEEEPQGSPLKDDSRFYIPEENIPRAEKIYGSLGVGVFSVLLAILAFFVVAMVAFVAVPDLTTLLSNFISGLSSSSL